MISIPYYSICHKKKSLSKILSSNHYYAINWSMIIQQNSHKYNDLHTDRFQYLSCIGLQSNTLYWMNVFNVSFILITEIQTKAPIVGMFQVASVLKDITRENETSLNKSVSCTLIGTCLVWQHSWISLNRDLSYIGHVCPIQS